MYLSFYHLKAEPFHITPNPEFLYLSDSHREALAAILYGVEKRKGFVLVSGEVGTGKTTVVRAYLEQQQALASREPADADKGSTLLPIYLFNSDLSFEEVVQALLTGLNIDPGPVGLVEKVRRLHWALIEAYRRHVNVAVFIDEAQNMPVETLEQLRMLSNIETHRDKLLQIVLIGQPELVQKLELHELRQLRQRVAVRACIERLSSRESAEYIRHRLARASLLPGQVFGDAALRRIVRAAKGYPRTLNIICDNSLVAGFGAQERVVSVRTVRRVLGDLKRLDRRPFSVWRRVALCGLALGLVLAGGILARVFDSTGDAPEVAAAVGGSVEAMAVVPISQPVEAPKPVVEPVPVATPPAPVPEAAPAPIPEPEPPVEPTVVEAPVAPAPEPAAAWQVKPGDTLSSIAQRVYGRADEGILAGIRDLNPGIVDSDVIRVGQTLELPPTAGEG